MLDIPAYLTLDEILTYHANDIPEHLYRKINELIVENQELDIRNTELETTLEETDDFEYEYDSLYSSIEHALCYAKDYEDLKQRIKNAL